VLATRLGESPAASVGDRRGKGQLRRPTRGTPNAITVARKGRRWFVSTRGTDVHEQPLPRTWRDVGTSESVPSWPRVTVVSSLKDASGGKLPKERWVRSIEARIAESGQWSGWQKPIAG
jgi:hypothetical protein